MPEASCRRAAAVAETTENGPLRPCRFLPGQRLASRGEANNGATIGSGAATFLLKPPREGRTQLIEASKIAFGRNGQAPRSEISRPRPIMDKQKSGERRRAQGRTGQSLPS